MITVRAGSTAIGVCLLLVTAGCSREQQDWRSAEAADSIDSYGQFIQRHPDSELVTQARARVAQLGEDRDWQRAGSADTVDAYREFIAQHPNGKWAQEAHIRIENFSLGEQTGTDAGTKVAVAPGARGGGTGMNSASASQGIAGVGGPGTAAAGPAAASGDAARSYGLAQPGESAAPARAGAPAQSPATGSALDLNSRPIGPTATGHSPSAALSGGAVAAASAANSSATRPADNVLATRSSRIIPATPTAAISPAAATALSAQLPSRAAAPSAAGPASGSASVSASTSTSGPGPGSGSGSGSGSVSVAGRGGFGIQLGAYSNEASASAQWRVLTTRYASELQGLQQHVVPADTGSGRIYRLQATVGDEGRARTICDQLKKHGQACVAVLPH